MSSNAYGFDFLQSQHLDDTSQNQRGTDGGHDLPSELEAVGGFASSHNKPDLEKQADVLAFLKNHRGSGCMATSVIYRATGVDLEKDLKVADSLQKNPKVKVEMVPDPENPALSVATYAYQAKYATVRDRASLLAQINRMFSGIPVRDLHDSYPDIEEDIAALIAGGDVIAVMNTEDKDRVLFPRGEPFLVEMDGIVSIPSSYTRAQSEPASQQSETPPDPSKEPDDGSGQNTMKPPLPRRANCYIVDTDVDPREQIRRGEAIQIGGQWFRISSAVKEGVSLAEQPARAQAPLSVVSLTELSDRNELDGYIRAFTEKKIPLDAHLCREAEKNLHDAKLARETLLKLTHGRTSGVVGQLLGSNAHSSNPTSLASSVAGKAVSNQRKRPTASKLANASQSKTSNVPKDALEKAAADSSLALFSHPRRHGCTLDVRDMYLKTRALVPESDADLKRLLVENKLLEPSEELRRKRMKFGSNLDKDGKPKKRRYYERKNQRMTNIHLDGTEIGAALNRAMENKKEGKTVGDGGM